MEHHFTVCPDVLQFLSYMAAKITHAKLGSMVVVGRVPPACRSFQ
jgi:hypothetical protein